MRSNRALPLWIRHQILVVGTVVLASTSALAAPTEPDPASAGTESSPFENATTIDTEVLLNAPVVTATGREQSRALAPANVVTWERDEIRRHGWTSLTDVLSNTPGLYVTDDLVLPQVGVRGVTPGVRGGTRIVRIMINGVQVNFRPDLTAFIGQEYIPFETVERIEIAKGPLSALYGANAFLATVNIITRRPENGIEGEAQGNVQVINNHGGAGYGARLGFGGIQGHVQLAFTGANYNRSGLKLHKTFANQDPSAGAFSFFDKDKDPSNGISNPSQNDHTRPKSLYGSAELKSDAMGQMFLQGGLQLLDSVAEFQPSGVLTHKSRAALRNDWVAARYIYGYGKDYTLSLNAGLSSGAPQDKEVLFSNDDQNTFKYTRNFGYTAIDLGGAFEAKLPASMELKTGVDFSYDREDVLYYTQTALIDLGPTALAGTTTKRIDPTLPLKRTISDVGLYAQLGGNPIAALPDLYVLGNIRYDDPNLFNSQVSWRTGVAYQWSPRITSKLFFGRAFQTPSGVQLFASPGYGQSYNIYGNRILPGANPIQPQTVFSGELANTIAITNTVAIDSSFYYQAVSNEVEFETVDKSFTARNQPIRRYGGGELGLRASSSRVSTYAYGSAQASTYTDDRGNTKFGFRAPPELPAFTIYGGTTLRLPEIFAAVDVVTRIAGARAASPSNITLNNGDRYTLPAYAVFDINITSLDWYIFSDKAETKFTASFKNIFDTRYSNPGYGGFDFPSVGRVMFFKLAQTF